jgi:hypothetical protein
MSFLLFERPACVRRRRRGFSPPKGIDVISTDSSVRVRTEVRLLVSVPRRGLMSFLQGKRDVPIMLHFKVSVPRRGLMSFLHSSVARLGA